MRRLRRALNWIIGVPIVAMIAAFAVANRQWIDGFLRSSVARGAARDDQHAALVVVLLRDLCRPRRRLAGLLVRAEEVASRRARSPRELQHGQDELSRLRRDAAARQALPSSHAA